MMHNETLSLHFNTVDRFNQEKLYIQLTRIFLDEIRNGLWKINARIPSEEELCKLYNVSKVTVRQAINNLVSDGYLMKIQGKGTFVVSVLPVVGLAMKTQFTEDMFGKEVMTEKELLKRGLVDPSSDIRAYLQTDDRIYHILGRRRIGGSPACLDDSYIPERMLPDIDTVEVLGTSLYLLLQERAVKKIFKLIQTIEVKTASGETAAYLDIEPGGPVLLVHRLLLSSDNTPVAYTRIEGRSDRYKFQTEFERLR